MPFGDVLVHRAWPVRKTSTGTWVEGKFVKRDAEGTPFDCCLFLPQGTKTAGGRGRNAREPTLLYWPEDDAGLPVALTPQDELLILAEEQNVSEGRPADARLRWVVNGAAQSFGKPGHDVIGFQVTLVRVDD